MNQPNQQQMDFSEEELALLDMDMDDIEDLPGFEVPSPGLYVLKLTGAIKKVNEKLAGELGYEVMECLKKDKEEDPDAVAGTKFSQLFFFQGDDEEKVKISLGVLKQNLASVAEHFGNGNLKWLFKESPLKDGIVITAHVARRADKQQPEIWRPRMSKIAVS